MQYNEISDSTRKGIFLTLIVGTFVTAMSTTVTANMIPDFTAYFGVSANLAQWLTSGATLISGIIIPVTAFLIKRVPNRIYFLCSMFCYTIGSLLAFLSFNFPMLLISRMIQAIGCGMMIPFGQIMLMNLYPAERHGRVMSVFSMASMVSTVVGPTYAGIMLEYFGWRGVFISLFVMGILILMTGAVFMKNMIPQEETSLNIGFVLLSAIGFSALLIGIGNIAEASLFSWNGGGLILVGIVFLALFTWRQFKSSRPMLNLRVFAKPSFLIAVIISIGLYLVSMGTSMIMPIFSKTICGFSDAAYGYSTLVGSILAVIMTMYAGHVYDKMGIKPMFACGLVLLALYSIVGILFTPNTSILMIGTAFALQSIAMSALNSPATTMALSDLSGKIRVDGSAVFNTLRQIASSLASTLTVVIYTLAGTGINGVHIVYGYYGIVTILIAIAVILYLRFTSKNNA